MTYAIVRMNPNKYLSNFKLILEIAIILDILDIYTVICIAIVLEF